MRIEVYFTKTVAEGNRGAEKPGIVEVFVDLLDAAAILGLHGQQPVEELEQPWGEALPHARGLQRHSRLPLHKLVVVGIAERGLLPGEAAREHAEEEDAHRPHVAGGLCEEPDLVRGGADLRRCVGDAAADPGNVGTAPESHAEIDELYEGAPLVSKNNVLGFDVAVDQLLAVHVLQRLCDLVEVSPRLLLGETHFWLDGVKQVAARCVVLHHHVRSLGLVGGVVGSDDEGMLREVLAVLELPLEVCSGGARFADSLDGDFLARGLVFGDPRCAIGALAGLLEKCESLVQAGLVGSSRFCSHCWFLKIKYKIRMRSDIGS